MKKASASGDSTKSGASSAVWDSISKMLLRNEETIRDLIDGNLAGGDTNTEVVSSSCNDNIEQAQWSTPIGSFSAHRRRFGFRDEDEEDGRHDDEAGGADAEQWFTPCVREKSRVGENEEEERWEEDKDAWFTPQARHGNSNPTPAHAHVDDEMLVRCVFVCAKENNWKGVIALLPHLEHADVRDPDGSGNTLLHTVSWLWGMQAKKVVKHCLRAGADINAMNTAGRTPIQLCVENGHKALALYLFAKGAEFLD